MLALYFVILFLLVYGMKIHRYGYDGYISKEQCNCVKGFFIVVVFCRHIYPYMAEAGYDFSLFGDKSPL